MFWKKNKKEVKFDFISTEYLANRRKRLEYLQGLFTYWNRQQNDPRRPLFERERLYLSNKSMMEHFQIEINALQKEIEYIEQMMNQKKGPD